jgi:myo-inositol 2-dehydrogenase/D-chiro-inositol 1-dehydrogenase
MSDPLRLGLVGTGWIGRFHAETLANRLPGATTLIAVADPNLEAAQAINAPTSYADPLDLIADPAVQAVAISSPAATHTDLVVAAAEAGKHVFCEKPMALTLDDADRAIDAAAAAGVALQVGFNRRFASDFAAAHDAIVAGSIGTPQMLRSLTRDPGISAEVAARVKPWTIFNETLIHDFDTLCWLNPGAHVTEVYAQADALVHPQFADAGYLDTSVVQLRFDNGAFAVAEASFQAVYGYDVRGEVFGSDGVLLAGKPPTEAGRLNTELFADAYVAQFAHFAECVTSGTTPSVTGRDARVALEIALAAAESVRTGAPVALAGAVRS